MLDGSERIEVLLLHESEYFVFEGLELVELDGVTNFEIQEGPSVLEHAKVGIPVLEILDHELGRRQFVLFSSMDTRDT